MSHKVRETIGTDGQPLPVLPPQRDARVWARLIRVMFYTPGFLAILLIKAGEPASFGITVELLMLSSATALVGGLFVASQSDGTGADDSSRTGTWSGALVLELLAAVPFLCAIPPLFHELANSPLLHSGEPVTLGRSLGGFQLLPAAAIVPFMVYQLAGYGTLHFVVPRYVNWIINLSILGLIIGVYASYQNRDFGTETAFASVLVVMMCCTVVYGVLKLRQMQADYTRRCPPPTAKESSHVVDHVPG
ncbi:MAG: hypothetical protein QNJ62_07890 [Methyloceanibacter sp.]|nr:hypothetical protein [Methyloceanibacter sp.]